MATRGASGKTPARANSASRAKTATRGKSAPRRERMPPIEIDARGKPPLGMSPREFLATYWQKRPVLIRQAFPDFECPITPDDLAGLSCEPLATSRLILHEPKGDVWRVRSGPFGESDFASTPQTHWTLLVQDCDKALAEIDALLAPFNFLPRWRVDDIMISYAAPGGSVGAHVDQYDVFLLQGFGRRRWMISADPRAPLACRDDVELKLLREFTPTHEWVLEPGDMLYLPPNVPHHGIALDDCLTISVGMRAPAVGEMLVDLAEFLGERLGEETRYRDPHLAPAVDAAEINTQVLDDIARLLAEHGKLDADTRAHWFGRFITRYRAAHAPMPAEHAIDAAALIAGARAGQRLFRSPWSRYAFTRQGRDRAIAFLAGEAYPCSLALARLIGSAMALGRRELVALPARDLDTLAAMANAGHWVLADD